MFKPMAITVCSAILGSLLLSLTAVPVGASFLLKLGGGAARGPVVRAAPALLHAPPGGADGSPGADDRGVGRRRRDRPRVAAVHRHRVHAQAGRGVDPHRNAQAAVGVAAGVGGDLDARRGDPAPLRRGEAGRDQDRPSRPGHRGDGHLPGRRLRHPASDRELEERPHEGRPDRRHVGGARVPARRAVQLHPADGHAPRRGGVRREGGRRREGVRTGCRRARAARRRDSGRAERGGRRRRPPGRGAVGRGAAGNRGRPGQDGALRHQRRAPARTGRNGRRRGDGHRGARRLEALRRRRALPGRPCGATPRRSPACC